MNNPHDEAPVRATNFEAGLARAEASVAVFETRRASPIRRLQRFLHSNPTMVPFIVLVASVAVFSTIVGGRFFQPFNLSLILQQVTIIGIIGIAQTLVILTAGIDLSVGAIMVLTSTLMGRLAIVAGLPAELAFLIGIAAGLGCGLINGFLVTYVRLPPFIVTLGSWSVFGALNLWYSGSQTIRGQEVAEAAPILQWMGAAMQFGGARITMGTLLMLALGIGAWYLLNRTAFGRHVYATGDDPDAARLAGINTRRVLLAVYGCAGLISAIGAWALIGRVGAISPTSGSTANLDSITATVIGGTSLFGGRGTIVGTLIGAVIVGVFRNGLALAGLDALWQEFSVGILIVAAVGIDQWIRRVSA
ncbi:ABC transporter permease [Rhizobium anhuiense]|uniref:ABC transporter permease n=1 Tax=Rhizobium anhuiense TaxID=1184720 RepID=UPI000BEA36D0|nr:ABC transporter permease [Rhizobium anhuiense]PDS63074.1 ABC transporter permease [Rhizobium anhuiense]